MRVEEEQDVQVPRMTKAQDQQWVEIEVAEGRGLKERGMNLPPSFSLCPPPLSRYSQHSFWSCPFKS